MSQLPDNENPYRQSESKSAEVFPLAPMDAGTTASTVLVLAAIVVTVVAVAVGSVFVPQGSRWILRLVAGLMVLGDVVLVAMVRVFSRPRCFELMGDGMRIVWPGRTRKLPKAAFAEMRILRDIDLGRMVRRFGVGGLFGSFGWFRSEYMGDVDAYVTRRGGLVYIRLKNRRPLLLTPVEPERFLAALKAIIET
jgi:hypothetical protein